MFFYAIMRSLLTLAFWIFIIWLVARFIRRKRGGPVKEGGVHRWWRWEPHASKEEVLSEAFFLVALGFFWVAIVALNNDLGGPLSWRTLLFISLAAGFAVSYRFKTRMILALSVVGLQAWWMAELTRWADRDLIKGGWIIFGGFLFAFTMYVLGRAHEAHVRLKQFAVVYTVLSTVAVTFALIFLSTRMGIQALSQWSGGRAVLHSWEFTSALAVCLGLFAAALVYALQRKRISWQETATLLCLLIAVGVIAVVPAQGIFINDRYGSYIRARSFTGNGALWAMVINAIAFLEVIGIAVLGYLRREDWMQRLGMLLLPVLLILKLIDWYFPLLDRSLFFILAGIAFLILARLQERFEIKRSPTLYTVMGLLSITGALAFLSTKGGLRAIEAMTRGKEALWTPQGVIAWLLFFGFAAWLIWISLRTRLVSWQETIAFLALLAMTAVLSLLPEQSLFLGSLGYGSYGGPSLTAVGTLWAVLFNIIVFAEVVGVILLGYSRRDELLVNLGAVMVFLLIILKYFDWFFTFMEKSLFFVLAGVLMLGLGWLLERGRKYVLSTMTEGTMQMEIK